MITDEAMIYLVKVNIALVVFSLFYRLLFSQDTFFTTRRICLLVMLGVSFLYPLVMFSFGDIQQENIQQVVVRYAGNLIPEIDVTADQPDVSIRVGDIVLWVYGLVVLGLLGRIVVQVFSIIRLAKRGKRMSCLYTRVIGLSDPIAPFSFFKWIFVSPSAHEPTDLKEILVHEKTHVKQLHSIDVMISELLCAFFWFNPAMWLLKREIRRNLEFLADKSVVYYGFNRKAYQYHLLRLSHPSTAVQLVNKFNVSPLKKRIMMMNKKRTSKMGLIKYALLLPVVGLLILSSNVQAIIHLNENDAVGVVMDSIVAKGVVMDEKNVPLEGVTVLVKGTGIGTSTNEKGEFSMKVIPNTMLVFSYVGKTNQFIPVKSEKKMQVKMLTASISLEESPIPVLKKQEEKVARDSNALFILAEDMPQFLAEDGSMKKFLEKNVKYPKEAREKKIEGKVFVSFVINKEGEVINPRVIRGVNKFLDNEALRVVGLMPNWKPGTQRGIPVTVSYTIPVIFKL